MAVIRLLVAVLCLIVAPSVRAAQAPEGHVLEGTVRDTSGAVLIGVAVMVNADGAEPRLAQTDDSGRFVVRGLASERYTVTLAAPGFREAVEFVLLDQPVQQLDVVMQIQVTESVQVTSDLVASGTPGLTATVITGAALQALPDDPGALLQRLRELAGVAGAASEVAITIDGFANSQLMPPKQAIQAIRVSSNWFAPEFAAPGQARVEIITKPGSSAVHGEIRLNVNDEALNARNAMAPYRASGHTRDVTGFVSGPVIPRRWSFVAYGGEWSQQQNQVIAATVLDATHGVARHLENVRAPRTVGSLWVGTNYQLAPLHTLAVSFSRTTDRSRNLGLSSGIDLPSRAYRHDTATSAIRTTLISVPSSRVFNEIRVEISPHASTMRAAADAPAVIVLDAFNAGANQDALFSDSGRTAIQVQNAITVYVPKHTLKAGADIRTASHRYTDRSNFGGVFLFGAADDRDAEGHPIPGSLIAPLDNYRRTILGLEGYGPSQFWIGRGDPNVRFRETSLGAYVQDDWVATRRLTVSYGFRIDHQTAASQLDAGARAGGSFALDETAKHVIRAGVGTFFDHIEPELTLDVTRLDGRHQEQLFVDRPAFFPAIPTDLGDAAVLRPTTFVADANFRAPTTWMSAVSYNREVSARMFVTLKYSFEASTRLARTVPSAGLTAAGQQARVMRFESSGRRRRHHVTTGWRWNVSRAASLFGNYTLLHGRGTTDGRRTSPADVTRLDEEYGPLAGDRAQRLTAGGQFELAGGLSLSPYLTVASGAPFNITSGFDANGDGLLTDRPARVAPGTEGARNTPYGWLLAPGPASAPLIGRNAGREAATMRVDVRLSRVFQFPHGAMFVLAANAENLFNRSNFESVNGVITSPAFGTPKRAGTPRRLTFSTGLSF